MREALAVLAGDFDSLAAAVEAKRRDVREPAVSKKPQRPITFRVRRPERNGDGTTSF